jgi:hypothetical protein
LMMIESGGSSFLTLHPVKSFFEHDQRNTASDIKTNNYPATENGARFQRRQTGFNTSATAIIMTESWHTASSFAGAWRRMSGLPPNSGWWIS